MIAAAYKRLMFHRLSEGEEIRIGLIVIHANSKAWDRKHRDEIRLDNACRWKTTEANLLTWSEQMNSHQWCKSRWSTYEQAPLDAKGERTLVVNDSEGGAFELLNSQARFIKTEGQVRVLLANNKRSASPVDLANLWTTIQQFAASKELEHSHAAHI